MKILGVDVSEYQGSNLPWARWKDFGVQFAIIRSSEGLHLDLRTFDHLRGCQDAGIQAAWYHAVSPRTWRDPAVQAQVFAGRVPEDDTPLYPGVPRYWLDVEVPGVDAATLTLFLSRWKELRPRAAIGIYTSKYYWQQYGGSGIVGVGHAEFAEHPLWVADYRGLEAPAIPDIWDRWTIYQFRSKTGYLPDYTYDLDVDRIELEVAPVPVTPPVPEIRAGSKIGLHAISPNQVMPLVRRAVAGGWQWPLVKMVNDFSPFPEIKQISPHTITLGRYMPSKDDEGMQAVTTWTATQRTAWAKRLIDLYFSRTSAEQQAATDYYDPLNEPGAHGVDVYRGYALALLELIRQANDRGLRLSVPALPQGTPEWAEMVALVETGLFGELKRGGHLWDCHEGVFEHEPIDQFYQELIPGAPLVPGAGAYNFRHRYLYSLLEERDEVVPMVISEFYDGGSYPGDMPGHLARFRWYDERARTEPYLLAFCGFTIDPDDHWRTISDYTPFYQSAELWDYVLAEKDRPNGGPMPFYQADKDRLLAGAHTVQVNVQALQDNAAAQMETINSLVDTINALVVDSPPVPWWQKLAPFPHLKAIAAPNKVLTFRHADGSAFVPNPRNTVISYALDVFEVNVASACLRVTNFGGNPDWWVAASDVSPNG